MKFAVALAAIAILCAGSASVYAIRSYSAALALPDRAIAVMLATGRPLRIAALGTSLTADYTWPARLEAELGGCLAGGVSVSVHARGGATSRFGVESLPDLVAEAPDVVLVEFATNDADLRRNMSRAESRARHLELVAGLKRARPDTAIFLMIMNPAQGTRRLLRPLLYSYDLAYGALARDHELGLVNLLADWAELAGEPGIWRDGVHPADAAATRIIVPAVKRAVLAGLGREDCGA